MGINYNGTDVDSIIYNGTDLTRVTYNNNIVWEKDPTNVPLTITALTDDVDLYITFIRNTSGFVLPDIQYSLSGGAWTTYTYNTHITLEKYQYVRFKSTTYTFSYNENNFVNFRISSGNVRVAGNVNSLINFSNILNSFCFIMLFDGCTRITELNVVLPATTLADYCYDTMFCNCTNITTAPELPATTLARGCYTNMFMHCTSLITPPELPATILTDSCYRHMFYRCLNLETAPELPATTLADNCYNNMFHYCIKLTTAPALPATTLATSCYYGMFYSCSGLTEPPELPATTLAHSCYCDMFRDCIRLITVPKLPATALTSDCYRDMFNGCTSLQVNDTQTAQAPYIWKIPEAGTFSETGKQIRVFAYCAGTRASDNLVVQAGQSCTYYTQNPPV